jgi:hypothetical protein
MRLPSSANTASACSLPPLRSRPTRAMSDHGGRSPLRRDAPAGATARGGSRGGLGCRGGLGGGRGLCSGGRRRRGGGDAAGGGRGAQGLEGLLHALPPGRDARRVEPTRSRAHTVLGAGPNSARRSTVTTAAPPRPRLCANAALAPLTWRGPARRRTLSTARRGSSQGRGCVRTSLVADLPAQLGALGQACARATLRMRRCRLLLPFPPVAPSGWPLEMRPPLGFTTHLPPARATREMVQA